MRSTSKGILAACALSTVFSVTLAPGGDGSLSSATVRRIQATLPDDAPTRALRNAVAGSELDKLAVNREILQGHDPQFTDKIDADGITNQRKSGRCWLFAATNVMRPAVVKRYDLDEFEFSKNYLAFWDKLEKSNCFLEYMVELADRDPSDRELQKVLEFCFSDGGWWENAVALIEKYGVVPKEVMPETASSGNTAVMNRVIRRRLKLGGLELRTMRRREKPAAEIRQAKEAILADVYRMLVLVLGEPPKQFTWRYENEKKLSELRTYTPQTFYADWGACNLSEYVNLGHDPSQPLGRHYELSRSRNVLGSENMHYANVKPEILKQASIAAIQANEPIWFAADVGKDQDRSLGIMAPGLLDYESLFGAELNMSKADRFLYGEGAATHAMVFLGVDLRDGRPVKWLVENSWGADRGDKGYWTLYDKWFDEHVYSVIVKRRHVSAEVLKIFEQKPKAMPVWHPMAARLRTSGD